MGGSSLRKLTNMDINGQVWFTLLIITLATSDRVMAATGESSNSTCIVDFSYVRNFLSTLDICSNNPPGNNSICCKALLNTLGIGLADYLNQTGIFEFRDMQTVNACMSSYQAALDQTRVNKNFQQLCFPSVFPSTTMFVQSKACGGIQNMSDWRRVVGTSKMDISCKGNLGEASNCQSCDADAISVATQLNASLAEPQQCVYLVVLYGAGVVNNLGPRDPGTASCLLGVERPYSSESKSQKAGLYAGVAAASGTLSLSLSNAHTHVRGVYSINAAVFVLLSAGAVYYFRKVVRKDNRLIGSEHRRDHLSRIPNLGLIKLSYEEIKAATQNFSERNFIGEGGYGKVYKGVLARYGNMEVAVKVMKNSSHENNAEFLNEVEVINRVRHRNLVAVRGACVHAKGPDGHQHILVYDYMPNGCLQDYLSSTSSLSWPDRKKIVIGTAVGINYLHNEVYPPIIHRDIKPSNILLDEDFNARVSDFGLAKIIPEGMSHLTSRVAGTPVYMAVEYALYGQCSDKVDVYSYGILLLELMSGRRALDTTKENPGHYHIVDWAWSMVKAGKVEEVIDEKIRFTGSINVMKRFILVGVLCAHLIVGFRPSISHALKMLEGDEEIPPIPDRPAPYITTNPNQSPYSLQSDFLDSSELVP